MRAAPKPTTPRASDPLCPEPVAAPGVSPALAGRAGFERDGHAVGCIGLAAITWGMHAWRVDRAELGYWLAKAEWNRGLMSEAARAIVRFAFETLGLHKIGVGCFVENEASRRVIERVGFRYVGRLEDDVWRDGRWWSHLRFELTEQKWRDLQTGTGAA